ncbi:MAG: DUF885 domain-containing protein [Deltaproteobacteria bacterium]|nr:DUF885 domain-containing protein [Deltaproteobacteria bacterium]
MKRNGLLVDEQVRYEHFMLQKKTSPQTSPALLSPSRRREKSPDVFGVRRHNRAAEFMAAGWTFLKTKPKVLFFVLSAAMVTSYTIGCASDDATQNATNTESSAAVHDDTADNAKKVLAELSDRYWDLLAENDPQGATQAGDHRFNTRIAATGPAHHKAHLAKLEGLLGDVKAARKVRAVGSLTQQEEISANLLEYLLADETRFAKQEPYVHNVDQMNGPQANLSYFFATYHPMKSASDVESLKKRLGAIETWVSQQIESLELGIKRGQTAPKVVVERVIAQLARFDESTSSKKVSVEKSVFGKVVERLPSTLNDDDKATERQKILSIIEEKVLPAWKAYGAFLKDIYLAHARENPGLSQMKEGKKLYSLLVKHHTTLDLTPEEIHQMGKNALAQIEEEMARLGKSQGVNGGAQAFLAHLKKDPKNYASSREALFATFEKALQRVEEKLPKAFGRLPKLPYEVKPMDATREKDAPAAYYQPGAPKDGRPGVFVANLYRFEERPTFNSDVLAFHEAVPGHHLQFALAQEMEGLPRFRQEAYITAYGEGWGLYSERLCDELGGYADVNTRMGYLGFAAWRASRLVVDTGLHHFGWTRAQAIAFMSAHTSLGKVDVENEVDRYIVIPGQALSYMVGALHLLSLRAHAKKSLGNAYSLPAFHDAVLEVGSVPLPVLDAHVTSTLKLPPHKREIPSIVAPPKEAR